MSANVTQVVAANSVETGEKLYMTACDEWTNIPEYAELIDDPDHAEFRLFVATRQDRIVSNPELAEFQGNLPEFPVVVQAA